MDILNSLIFLGVILAVSGVLILLFYMLNEKIYRPILVGDDSIMYLSEMVMGAMLFSLAYLIIEVIEGIKNSMSILQNLNDNTLLNILFYGAIFYGTALILSTLIIWFSLEMAKWLVSKNQQDEKSLNEDARFKLILIFLIITLVLIIKEPFGILLDSIQPYPEIPNFH